MQSMLPRLDYRATSKLQPGSVIEYEVEKPFSSKRGVKINTLNRALALITRIEWAPRKGRSRVHVLTEGGELRVVDMCYVCRIHIL